MVQRSSVAHLISPETSHSEPEATDTDLDPIDAEELEYRRLQAKAVLDLSRIRRETERRLTMLLKDFRLDGITAAQANALLVLFQERGALTARRLAEEMVLSEVTVGRFVHALESAGWIERQRDPTDARAILLRPTAKAFEALPRFIKVTNMLLDEAFVGFEREEVQKLLGAVDRVRKNLDQAQGLS